MNSDIVIFLFLIFIFLLAWQYIWAGIWYNSTKYKLIIIKTNILHYLHEKNINSRDIENVEDRLNLIISNIKNFSFLMVIMVFLLKSFSKQSNKTESYIKQENTFKHLDEDIKEYLNNRIQECFYNIFKYMVLKSFLLLIFFVVLTVVKMAKRVSKKIMSKIFTDEIVLAVIEHDIFYNNKIQKI